MATRERSEAAQETASDLTTDLRNVYGLRGISMFMPRPKPTTTKKKRLSGAEIHAAGGGHPYGR